ncbi:MAG: glycosyltransferase family 4 protein [Planctomycetota bacterium]|jgi:glycosyltransferase involved in cell wall biosynthesis
MTAPPPDNQPTRVVILNQYYVPDVASTGHLLSELADYLSRNEDSVSVITAIPSYGPPSTWQDCPRRETANGVEITRVWTTRFDKNNILGRTINSLTFILQMTGRVIFRRQRGEVFLYTTNPPYLPVVGAVISLIRKHPYVVLLHDSYPQLAVLVGKIRAGGIAERIWHRLNRFMYRRAEQTIVLCKAARRLVCESYGIPEERVHVISNWADGAKLHDRPKTESEFAREQGLIEPFVVLYSGNLGLYYDFESILGAAERLLDEPRFRLVFVGSGGRRDWVEQEIERRGLTNTVLLPYQPFDKLPDSLTACDASLVTIAKGVEGISYPSKLYASLAVGRPILALSEEWSELRELVESQGVGHWFPLGESDRIAACIREMIDDPARCAEQGRRARALFERSYTLEASGRQYDEVLHLASPLRAASS